MEIQYEQLTKWSEITSRLHLYSLERLLTSFDDEGMPKVSAISSHDEFVSFITGGIPEVFNDQLHLLQEAVETLRENFIYGPKFSPLHEEIELNIANISSADQVRRYLGYVRKQVEYFIWRASFLSCDLIEVHRRDLIPQFRSKTSSPVKLNPNINVGLDEYLFTCLLVYYLLKEVLDTIDENYKDFLNPEPPFVLHHGVEAITHKLLLLHRLGLFTPLMDSCKHLNDTKFGILICQIIGEGKGSHDTMRKEAKKLKNEINNTTKNIMIQNGDALNAVNALLTEIGYINNA
jgi:hypothetical protein